MEFSLPVTGAVSGLIEIERRLVAVDPAAMLDLSSDGTSLRISTMASEEELIECLRAAGIPARVDDLTRLPSVCCGGCGG